MQPETRLNRQIAWVMRLIQQGQNPPQLRHQVARHLPFAILFHEGAKPLVPNPHRAIVARNAPRCNPIALQAQLDRIGSDALTRAASVGPP